MQPKRHMGCWRSRTRRMRSFEAAVDGSLEDEREQQRRGGEERRLAVEEKAHD